MKYLSLFSGIGGFEYGLEQSKYDFECVGFSEIDDYAKSIYLGHFPQHRDLGDASKIDPKGLQDFDLLVGGFPCQAFSLSGHRRGFDDTRGTLFFEIARICAEKRPKYLLLENVKGLLSHSKGETFKKMLGILSELGYDVEWQVFNSKDFGTAQNRERVYIKGYFRAKCGGEILSVKRECREAHIQIDTLQYGSQAHRIRSIEGNSSALCGTAGGQGGKTGLYLIPKLKPHKFDRQVKKRVHTVDYDELCEFLRKHKSDSGVTVSEISKVLDISVSEVEHWFRRDKYFAPPPSHIWNQLKQLLDITDDKYDAFITEFEWVDGVYEMDKRAYDESGLSPTLCTTETLAKINVVGNTSATGNHCGNDVFGEDGLSRTLTASNYKHPLKVKEKIDNPKIVGNVYASGHWSGNIYDTEHISPTMMGQRSDNVVRIKEPLKVATNTKKGYDEITTGDGLRLCHPTSKKARGRSQKGMTGALSTSADWGTLDEDYRIRRLTPLECERLQAFPDGWTEFGKDGERISDTQRYKCLGNAVTTSVITYIINESFFGGESESQRTDT